MRRHGRAGKGQDSRREPLMAFGALSVALVGVLSCQGDTLYPPQPAGVTPPVVTVVLPAAGSQVVAGRRFPVRIVASDTLGISEMQVEYSGAASGLIRTTFNPPLQRAELDTSIVAPASGQVDLRAVATDVRGAVTRTDPISVTVGADQVAPSVSVSDTVPSRLEPGDSMRISIVAADNPGGSGLVSVGATVLAVRGTRPDTAVVATRTLPLSPPRSDTVTFKIALPGSSIGAPGDSLGLLVYAFAVDSAGNCAASTPGGARGLLCVSRTVGGAAVRISAERTASQPTKLVAGRSFGLAAGANIVDLMPDVARSRVFLSDPKGNRLQVLDLQKGTASPVLAGSSPWGLALNPRGDTLIVANSGGTNISFLGLTGSGSPQEDVSRRILTPNDVLFEVAIVRDTGAVLDSLGLLTGDTLEHYKPILHDFSDRPQFLAQDARGRVVYSTMPTPAAPLGTIRAAVFNQGWSQPEVRLPLIESQFGHFAPGPPPPFCGQMYAIAQIDSLRVFYDALPDSMYYRSRPDAIELYDHVQGFPKQIIRSGRVSMDSAISRLRAQGSDIVVKCNERWDLRSVGFHDTTYVSASGDHRFVGFAEGSVATGRVLLWNSDSASISNEITETDLIGNASEHLTSLDLNQDGSLGVVRGLLGAYYFTNDLRLQGSAPVPVVAPAGNGAVLDPAHPTFSLTIGPRTLSYVATSNRSIQIYETLHYSLVGEIPLRDNIVGPLRASAPPAGCTASTCPIARLYGVTSAGSLVVVDVLPSDVHLP